MNTSSKFQRLARSRSLAFAGALGGAVICSPALGQTATTDSAPASESQASPDDGRPVIHFFGMGVAPLSGSGLEVVRVAPLSPAHEAGVRRGDVLVKLGDYRTEPLDVFREAVDQLAEKKEEGDTLSLEVRRNGDSMQLELTERKLVESDIESESESNRKNKQQQQSNNQNQQGGETLAGSPYDSRQASGSAGRAAASSNSGMGGAGAAGQDNSQGDVDAYFYGGGSGVLTSSQLEQQERLRGIADRRGLTNAQQQEMRRLESLSNGRFADLQPLSDDDRSRLDQLRQQAQSGERLSDDDRATLRQLTAREAQSNGGDVFELRARLEQGAQAGLLSDQQQQQLQRLRNLGLSRNTQQALNRSRVLDQLGANGAAGNALSPEQQSRLQQLSSQQGGRTRQQLAEMRRLRTQQQNRAVEGLQNEYAQLRQRVSNGGQLSRAEQARFQQLQQNRTAFSSGADLTNLGPPLNANGGQQAGNRAGGVQSTGEQPRLGQGSGIGLGGQPATGGATTGNTATGNTASGGTANGGVATGGGTTGGANTGGGTSGGGSGGGSGGSQ
ncbi:hypothetical protein Mal64_22030 [Pseudobythopirellula maris]|uniref:PDZ domain-containing protein n=1 Tax=Pseudobythopirellula maris TaxID=2527991 RepID=A0A5C5ZNR0_9BACT|nr:hypothetical protein Mal64_22030 [Pseudobythopirellula maris]